MKQDFTVNTKGNMKETEIMVGAVYQIRGGDTRYKVEAIKGTHVEFRYVDKRFRKTRFTTLPVFAGCAEKEVIPAQPIMDDADAVKADYNARLRKLIGKWNKRTRRSLNPTVVDTTDRIISEIVAEFALEAKPVTACSRDH